MRDRHRLVWLTAEGWQAVLHERAGKADAARALPALQAWRDAGFPLVVRRAERTIGASADTSLHTPIDTSGSDWLPLGLPLPPDPVTGIKPRMALLAAPHHVLRHAALPTLLEAMPCAPAHWRDPLATLCADAAGQGMTLRVFGSLAWQHLTGKAYVSATSDIDLLWQPANSVALDAGIALLARHAEVLPLDGEILFPSGLAVAWKEWRQVVAQTTSGCGSARVLVKSIDAVGMMPATQLLGHLGEPACVQ